MTTREKCKTLAKKIAKMRDHYTCQRCGKKSPEVKIDGAHIYSEGYGSLCADPENIIALCAGCHTMRKDSWHESPLLQEEWFEKKFPGLHERLKFRIKIEPIKEYQWKEKLVVLKEEWRKISS